jgi:hypothetical protein
LKNGFVKPVTEQGQQPFEMSSNYYTQLYRPTTDSDGQFSPFLAPGAAIKYGNISVLTGQVGHIPAEVGIFHNHSSLCFFFYFLSPALAVAI